VIHLGFGGVYRGKVKGMATNLLTVSGFKKKIQIPLEVCSTSIIY